MTQAAMPATAPARPSPEAAEAFEANVLPREDVGEFWFMDQADQDRNRVEVS